MTNLIGLHGRRGSGKDTAFSYIERWAERRDLTAVRKGLADKLKHSAFRALGFQIEESDALALSDDLKSVGEITTCIPGQSVLYTISGRKFLQLYGTEAHRDIFGDDFWLDALLPLRKAGSHPLSGGKNWEDNFVIPGEVDFPDFAVVTDIRFENEAQRVHDLGGKIWMIDRASAEEGDHVSDVLLPNEMIDTVIDNNGSLEELEQNITAVLVGDYHMQYVEGP